MSGFRRSTVNRGRCPRCERGVRRATPSGPRPNNGSTGEAHHICMRTSAAGLARRICAILRQALVLAGVGTLALSAQRVAAAPAPPGTLIQNIATATFVNTAGSPETIDSNAVVLSVTQVGSFTLTASQTRTAAPGASVNFPHTLTNTGNGTDTFDLSITNGAGSFDFSSVALYIDADGNGVPDNAVPITTTGPLAPGAQFRLVAVGVVPAGALAGQSDQLSVAAQGNAAAAAAGGYAPAAPQSNVDVATVTGLATLTVTKSLDLTTGPSPNDNAGNHITVTLTYVNAGAAPATNVVLTDVIGLPGVGFNTQAFSYVAGSGRWNGLLLSDASGGDPAGISYEFNQSAPLTVRAVIGSVAPGTGGTVSFKVDVQPGFPGGSAFSNNVAAYTYNDGAAVQSATTNSASYVIVGAASGPDLILSKTHIGDFITDKNYAYTLLVRNTGVLATTGMISVVDTLPAGLVYVPAGSGGPGWACGAAGQVVTCNSTATVPAQVGGIPGQHPAPLTIVVRPSSAAFPILPFLVTNAAIVTGGGEPVANTGDNDAADPTLIQPPSSVSGRVWPDTNHNRIYESGAETASNLGGWLVEICPQSAAACDASTRVDFTTTAADGTYTINEIAAGDYKLQFRNPYTNAVTGTPVNGDAGVPQPNSSEDPAKRYLFITLNPGNNIVQQSLPLDPSGVVFDSVTRAPLAGAIVSLSGPPGFENFLLGGAAGASQTTGPDGAYQFVLTAGFPTGTYTLNVTPPAGYAPAPSTIFPPEPGSLDPPTGCVLVLPTVCSVDPTNLAVPPPSPTLPRYFMSFTLSGGDPEVVNNHIPIDPAGATPGSGLLASKAASRTVVEVGEFVDYAVRVRNTTAAAFTAARLQDTLPFGFAYVRGSARLDGTAMPDPPSAGPTLDFALGTLPSDSTVTVTYRVRVGPGAMLGDGINSAQASAANALSNVAQVKVHVHGGVFSDRGYLLGKVFMDCNASGVQDHGEPGVPGVGLVLEDGTMAVTDSEGKYSLYGLVPRTHALKLDATTLPRGAQSQIIANRQALDPDSRFVDLKKGELHRADFALGACTPDVMNEVERRRGQDEVSVAETDRLLQQRLAPEVIAAPVADPRSQPAAGVIGGTPAAPQRFEPVAPQGGLTAKNSNLPPAPVTPLAQASIEDQLPELDPKPGFLVLTDGATLPIAQTNVWVKGSLGATLRLELNGSAIPETRVGKRSKVESKGLEAWEYVGLDLKPGTNTLTLVVIDPFGNERGRTAINLVAPSQLGRILLEMVDEAPADGHTEIVARVRLTDDQGVPVTVRTPLTLESQLGRWQVQDLNPTEPGVQVFMEGGSAQFVLLPPDRPGEDRIRVSSGILKADRQLSYLPALRPLIAIGVVEGTVNFRSLNLNNLLPVREHDSFEQEISNWSNSSDKTSGGARAALYLKGMVKGDYLLTLAYDSDKDTGERLFRDIQPDQFYPVYGDASVKGYDAQSTSHLYVRLDKGRSFLMYGDFNTLNESAARKLSQYSRSLTGLRGHYEDRRVSVNAFASQDTFRQVVQEIPANGTSGPFQLSAQGVINSEKVEILTRDRDQPAIILKVEPQTRFSDYELEPFTGRLLFKAPVPSLDPVLNPISIRVTYEVDQEGEPYWTGGVDGQVRVTDAFEVGANYVQDDNPLARYQLGGANATLRLSPNTFALAEIAQSDDALLGTGEAHRIEVRHDDARITARAYYGQTQDTFRNPSSYLSPGRLEAGARVAARIAPRTVLKAEALRTEDEINGGRRDGALAEIEHTLGNSVRLELGTRWAEETAAPAQLTSIGTTPNGLTTVRGKVTAPIPTLPRDSVYAEYEQDIHDPDKQLAAIGGEHFFSDRGKLYARHEFLSSLLSPFALNDSQERNVTVVGIDTEYLPDQGVFSEYRMRDAIDGRTAEAAIGLRNGWTIAEGLRLNTTAEQVRTLDTASFLPQEQRSQAYTGAIEYTANPLWKASARVEYRDSTTSDSWLVGGGLAWKISQDWTTLARTIYSRTENELPALGSLTQARFQLGAAYRDTVTNRWNALAMVEHRLEEDSTLPSFALRRSVEIASMHIDYQPERRWIATGRLAAKLANEDSLGIHSRYTTQLVSARVLHDISSRWDAGVQMSALLGNGTVSAQYGFGIEAGYLVVKNLWVSVGYNFFGFYDRDLTASDYLDRGVFLRLRFKFDERSLQSLASRAGIGASE